MSESKSERDLTPFGVAIKGKPNAIAVAVPVDFANGVAVLYLKSEPNLAILASVKMVPGYYKSGSFRRSSRDLEMTPDAKIFHNLHLVLRYLSHIKDFLLKKNKKGSPPTFSQWNDYLDMTGGFPPKDLKFVEPF